MLDGSCMSHMSVYLITYLVTLKKVSARPGDSHSSTAHMAQDPATHGLETVGPSPAVDSACPPPVSLPRHHSSTKECSLGATHEADGWARMRP